MGFHILTSETITCQTRNEILDLALQLKDLGGIEGERTFSSERMARIKDAVLGGETLPFDWAIALLETPTTHDKKRVNGQHSGTMFLELTDEEWDQVTFPLYIHYTTYACETDDDRLMLFEQFDQRWSARSDTDIMGVHVAANPALQGRIHPGTALALGAALKWYHEKALSMLMKGSRVRFNFVQTTDPYILDFYRYAGTFLEPSKAREMLKVPVLAAMFHTTRDNSQQQYFWKEVALGKAQLEGGSIAYKLAEFLEEYRRGDHASWPPEILRKLRGRKNVSPYDAFATCIRACRFIDTGKIMGDVFVMSQRQSVRDLIGVYYPKVVLPPSDEQAAAD